LNLGLFRDIAVPFRKRPPTFGPLPSFGRLTPRKRNGRRDRRHASRLTPPEPPDSLRSESYGEGFVVLTSSAIALNCSNAACRSSAISRAITSGGGRLAESSRDSSLSQKMSRLTLSLLSKSS